MENIFEKALGVEQPWFIEQTVFETEQKRLDIWINFKRGWRFPLEEGGTDYPVHDTDEKTWRHLNFFQHECYLHVRVPRVRTDDGRTITVLPPWAGRMLGFTLLFEALLLELCRNMPVDQVARMTGVSDNKLWRMLDLYVEAARFDEDCSQLSTVGMDETSVAKGHDYITLFVDMMQRKTLHIAEGKGSDTVKDFVGYLAEHNGTPDQIKAVSCDMSPAFIKGVNDNLPKAEITFDKFHILKIINEAVDDVRREEAKTNPLLKKTRYIFLKNEANLTDKERTKKEELKLSDLNLQSMEALRMRETFQQIYHAGTETAFAILLQECALRAAGGGHPLAHGCRVGARVAAGAHRRRHTCGSVLDDRKRAGARVAGHVDRGRRRRVGELVSRRGGTGSKDVSGREQSGGDQGHDDVVDARRLGRQGGREREEVGDLIVAVDRDVSGGHPPDVHLDLRARFSQIVGVDRDGDGDRGRPVGGSDVGGHVSNRRIVDLLVRCGIQHRDRGRGLGPPFALAVWPVNTWVVDVPAELVSVTDAIGDVVGSA